MRAKVLDEAEEGVAGGARLDATEEIDKITEGEVGEVGKVDIVEPVDAGGVAAADVVGAVASEPTVRVLRASPGGLLMLRS